MSRAEGAEPPSGLPPNGFRCVSWRRRRAAAARLVALDCGCSDPWPCRCTDPPLTDQAVDGWAAAARHLLADGRIPLLPLDVLRALHRRRGPDRALAEQLHAVTGGAAA